MTVPQGTVASGGQFIPHEPRVIERVPMIPPQPDIHAARREDFATDEAWAEFQKVSRDLHHEQRLDAAHMAWLNDHCQVLAAWIIAPPAEVHRHEHSSACQHGVGPAAFRGTDGKWIGDTAQLLAWHEATARQDGAANAKLLREFAEAMGVSVDGNGVIGWGTYPKPTDKELVEWARARRAAAEGSAGK